MHKFRQLAKNKTTQQMKKLNPFRISCIVLLWLALCYLLIKGHGEVNLQVVLTIIGSGIIILVPLYKKIRRDKQP